MPEESTDDAGLRLARKERELKLQLMCVDRELKEQQLRLAPWKLAIGALAGAAALLWWIVILVWALGLRAHRPL